MRRIQILGALFLVLALAACGPKTAPAPAPSPSPAPSPAPVPQLSDWDKVLAAAKKEGTVTVYSTWGAKSSDALKAGMKQYGVNVEVVAGTGGALEAKISTEQRAKANVADIFAGGWSNQANAVQAGFGDKVTVALPALANKSVFKQAPDKYMAEHGVYLAGTQLTPSLIVNSDLVRAGEILSWQDLLDPKWKGKMVMSDPRTGSGPGASGLGFWSAKLGEDFWKKMAGQNIMLYIQYGPVVDAIVHGDKAVAVFPAYSSTTTAIRAGAPIRIVHLKEGTSYPLQGIVPIKSAPHPNAAMVLLNWYFSREGQAALGVALDSYTVRNDVTESWLTPDLNPKNFTMLEPPNNLDPTVAPKAAELAKTIFGK